MLRPKHGTLALRNNDLSVSFSMTLWILAHSNLTRLQPKNSRMPEIANVLKATSKTYHCTDSTLIRVANGSRLLFKHVSKNYIVCQCVISHVPEESHLLIFLLIITDDLRSGHAHLYTVNNKLSGSLQGLIGKVL